MARFANFKDFQTNNCLFGLDPWIPGSQMARFANHKGFKQMTVFLTWFPGSLDPTWLDLQFLMVLKQMAVFLTWIPGSLDAIWLHLRI